MTIPLMLLDVIDSDSAIKKFLEATASMSAADRAKELEKNKVRHCTVLFVTQSPPLGHVLTLSHLLSWDCGHTKTRRQKV